MYNSATQNCTNRTQTIENCVDYQSKTSETVNCEICKDGYHLFIDYTTKDERTICQINEDYITNVNGCKLGVIVKKKGLSKYCMGCEKGKIGLNYSFGNYFTTCEVADGIPNCDINGMTAKNQRICWDCAPGY